jgi:hypothetical protein
MNHGKWITYDLRLDLSINRLLKRTQNIGRNYTFQLPVLVVERTYQYSMNISRTHMSMSVLGHPQTACLVSG